MLKYKIADIVFEFKSIYRYSRTLCENYLYFGQDEPCFSCQLTQEDIDREKREGSEFHDAYLECLALYRKLCEYIIDKANGIIFHSSAIMVDGEAYLFTAKSGTGKSTHARLWREMLGEKAVMINDDKPIIRYVDGEFYVYGTPWNGKHRLDTNTRAKIKAICKIYQDKENSIKRLEPKEMLNTVMAQTVLPTELEKMDKFLMLIDKMLKSVNLYTLGCDISRQAAELSYTVMKNGE